MTVLISRQLQIVKKLTDLIERVNPTNVNPCPAASGAHYTIDLRNKVFRGRTVFGQDKKDRPPFVSILESPKPLPGEYVGDMKNVRKETLVLMVQGFMAESDSDHPADPAYELKAMIEQEMNRATAIVRGTGAPVYPEDYLFGVFSGATMITGLTIAQGAVRPPDANVSPTAFFYLPVVVEFMFDPARPWALT